MSFLPVIYYTYKSPFIKTYLHYILFFFTGIWCDIFWKVNNLKLDNFKKWLNKIGVKHCTEPLKRQKECK